MQNNILKNFSYSFYASLLILLGCLLIILYGDFRQVEAVPRFWWGVGVMGLGFILSWRIQQISSKTFWIVAILSRLLLLPMYPGDDVWRYLWEGYIQLQGFSPYDLAPDAVTLVPFRTEWWELMNHPHISAIYPPITQLGFRLLAAIDPNVILFKTAFILADLAVCWLLSRRFGYLKTLLYAWNPVIIYSFAGGAHYDSWFLLPLVGAWLLYDQKQKPNFRISALLLGISAAIKWISLPILSFILWQALRRIGWRLAAISAAIGLLPIVLSAIPFCYEGQCRLIPTGSEFVVRGRSAELFPYLVELIWPASNQINWIYLIPLAFVGFYLLIRSRTFENFALGYFFSVLVLSPVVHSWYFTWLVPLAVPTQNLGVRLISLSSFIYFVLQYNLALGGTEWKLSHFERLFLWMPLLYGYFWSSVNFSEKK